MVKNKTLLISFFCLSLLLGIGIKDNIGVGELNASPAPLYLTMQQRDCDTKFNDEINITYDLNTTKTTILGNSNCKVNFTTVGELKPTIVTKIERDTIIKGYLRVDLAKVKPLVLPKLNITH